MRPIVLFLLLSLLLAGCSPGSERSSNPQKQPVAADAGAESTGAPVGQPAASKLPDLGAAPELENNVWLNRDQPLRLADLRGKVVGLEMWTFGCVNCRNVIPHLKTWHSRYHDKGFVLIGNHYPEFRYEHDLSNLQAAVTELEIPYAVAQDNEGVTWRAYNNRYWPTLYLIDKQGRIRYIQIGEGNYEATEEAIVSLLAEPSP